MDAEFSNRQQFLKTMRILRIRFEIATVSFLVLQWPR